MLACEVGGVMADETVSVGDRLIAGIWREAGMPLTLQSATSENWTAVDGQGNCTNGYGKRMRLNGRLTPTLLFDANGRLAGMQASVNTTKFPLYPESNLVPVASKGLFMQDPLNDDVWSLTIHFRDVANVCEPNQAETPGSIGDRFLIRRNNTFESIPLTADGNRANLTDLASNWFEGGSLSSSEPANQRGGCAPTHFAFPGSPGMGHHYWGNITSPDVACEDAGPMFLLYDHSKLVAFGLVFAGKNEKFPTVNGLIPENASTPGNPRVATSPPDSLWETAHQPLFPLFFSKNKNLKCAANMNKFNSSLEGGDVTVGTIHFHLQNPLQIGCDVLPQTTKTVGKCADGTYPWCRDLSWPVVLGPNANVYETPNCNTDGMVPLCANGELPNGELPTHKNTIKNLMKLTSKGKITVKSRKWGKTKAKNASKIKKLKKSKAKKGKYFK
eukprot:CAMPEP_0194306642 /NCGR_PEP_ID=MMETSP0171-20130528/3708_1 /TAXON_ID=218684 /ORGANISM="Corethron pennatum, Strain L29A3" /LENGTH=443 /DNA_ID=CAMNT_0039058453 /DNA_START=201 /DNA_END=1532 /DNA_ORIENTATION=+